MENFKHNKNFKIRFEDQIAVLTFYGEIECKTLVSAFSSLLSHHSFRPDTKALWDFNQGVLVLSYKEISEIAEQVVSASKKRSDSSCSAFVTSDEGNRSLLTTYLAKTARYPTEFRLFSKTSEALEWLN